MGITASLYTILTAATVQATVADDPGPRQVLEPLVPEAPDGAHEAMCNLWRAREDAVGLLLKARRQLKAYAAPVPALSRQDVLDQEP